ncbi:MAG: hypothetical protein IJZ77_04390 [Bacilli bacterium]|nr:hypothetical protein [Bacilli bacterium]
MIKHANMLKDDKSYKALNLSKDYVSLFEDGVRSKEESGNYEWWYSDFKLEDGSSLVIVFYTAPIVGSSKFKPHVSLNYIRNDGLEIRNMVYANNDYSLSRKKCDVRIKNCYIIGDLKNYEIKYDDENVKCLLTLKASTPSWRPHTGKIMFSNNKFFSWLPSVPEGKVEGSIEVNGKQYQLKGTGYHDHNWGNIPMFFLMHHWYWGRGKIGDYVFINSYITANKKHNYDEIPIFMLAKDGKIVADNAENYLNYKELDYEYDEVTKHNFAKKIVYEYQKDNEKYVITYLKEDSLERQGMETQLNKIQYVGAYLIGLRGSYHRVIGTINLKHYIDDNLVEDISSKGIWEQMYFGKDRILESKD